MKKLNRRFNQKDRVVCVTVQGGHEFYYQPVDAKNRILLFITDRFSGSVFTYFRDKGRRTENGFSLTMRELYDFNRFYNVKLTTVIRHIQAMIDYVICEHLDYDEAEMMVMTPCVEAVYRNYDDSHELAA